MPFCASRKYLSSKNCVPRFACDAISSHDSGMNLTREKIGAALRQLRKSQRLTLEEIAIRAEFDAGNLSRVERGLQGVADETLYGIATALGVRVSDIYALAEGHLHSQEVSHNHMPLEPGPDVHLKVIPVVGNTQGGPDHHWFELGHPTGFGEEYVEYSSRDPSAYVLRVRGNSMAPRVFEGEGILVEPSHTAYPGDEVVVKLDSLEDGETMVKLLLSDRDGIITLGSIATHERIEIQKSRVVLMHFVAGTIRAGAIRKR